LSHSENRIMEPQAPEGQFTLTKFGFFKRPRTQEDGPLLGVARTRFIPEVEAGMRQQEELAQQRRKQAAASAPAIRPVGRPPMDPASRPLPKEKRPVGRPRASTRMQAPPPEVPAPAAGATVTAAGASTATTAAAGGEQEQQQQQQQQEKQQQVVWLRLEVHLNSKTARLSKVW